MMDGEDILVGEYRKSPAFSGYHIFTSAGHIERYMEDAIFRFHETKKDDPIMAARNLFGNIINIHPFEDGNGRICRLILAHVLIQMKCCLFPVILSSFHRRGRRHYIRAVKMFDRKPSMLYTMIVKFFEQNARLEKQIMIYKEHKPEEKKFPIWRLLFFNGPRLFFNVLVIMDNLRLNDLEIHDSNQKQSLKRDDSQAQSSSFSQTSEEVLKQLGLNQALTSSTIESMTGPFNHQRSIYYVQRSIEELVQSSPQANNLAILQTCFEEGRATELQTYLIKSNLLKHQSLQYWMHLHIEYVNDQVNNKQNIENNGAKQGEWYSINAGNTRNGTWQISCMRLGPEDVDSFVREDSKFRTIVESKNHWFHGTNERSAGHIMKNGIILQQGHKCLDFSHGQGFYLNPSFGNAKVWLLQKSSAVSSAVGAVLIYNFSRDSFKGV